MDYQKLKTRSLIMALLSFLGFIGWQFVTRGKAELVDFLAAVIMSIVVGFVTWYIGKRKFGIK